MSKAMKKALWRVCQAYGGVYPERIWGWGSRDSGDGIPLG